MSPTETRFAIKDVMDEVRLVDMNMDELQALLALMTATRKRIRASKVVPHTLVAALVAASVTIIVTVGAGPARAGDDDQLTRDACVMNISLSEAKSGGCGRGGF